MGNRYGTQSYFDSQQLTIFPKPELGIKTYSSTFLANPESFSSSDLELKEIKSIISKLEIIALSAQEYSLLFGEPEKCTLESGAKTDEIQKRYAKIVQYVHGSSSGITLIPIEFETELIGAAFIWNGTQPFEDKDDDPVIELAYMHPKYSEFNINVKLKLNQYLKKMPSGF